jgi:hypothetical protein
LEDLGLGKKGIAEILADLVLFNSKYHLEFSAFVVVTGPWIGGPGTHHWVEALASVPLETKDRVPSNVFPDKWSKVLEVASSRGTPS